MTESIEALDLQIKKKNKELLAAMEEATKVREMSEAADEKARVILKEVSIMHAQYAELQQKDK